MKDLTEFSGVIQVVCDGDRPVGRKVITVAEMVELHEKEKAAERGNAQTA